MLHTIVVYLHIIGAILSIGPFFVLFPLLTKMAREQDLRVLQGYVEAFRLAVQVVKHAGHFLIVFGILAAITGGYSWTTPWIVVTFVMLMSAVVYLARAFKPTLRTFGTPQFVQHAFVRALRKAVLIYVVLLLIMLWLMVAKPLFW